MTTWIPGIFSSFNPSKESVPRFLVPFWVLLIMPIVAGIGLLHDVGIGIIEVTKAVARWLWAPMGN